MITEVAEVDDDARVREVEKALIARAQAGDDDAFEELYKKQFGWLMKCGFKAAREVGFTDREEIEQSQRIALWKAVRDFDPTKERRLTTFVAFKVRAQVQRAEIYGRLMGPKYNYSELAKNGARLYRPRRLDAPLRSTNGDRTLGDTLADHRATESPDDDAATREEVAIAERIIERALVNTCQRNREIIRARYRGTHTLEELAEEYGISRERVRQLESFYGRKVQQFVERYQRASIDERAALVRGSPIAPTETSEVASFPSSEDLSMNAIVTTPPQSRSLTDILSGISPSDLKRELDALDAEFAEAKGLYQSQRKKLVAFSKALGQTPSEATRPRGTRSEKVSAISAHLANKGPSTAADIAKATGIHHKSVHSVLHAEKKTFSQKATDKKWALRGVAVA